MISEFAIAVRWASMLTLKITLAKDITMARMPMATISSTSVKPLLVLSL
jgi:hypothetical protein